MSQLNLNPECEICSIISSPDNNDVQLFQEDMSETGWRVVLMKNQGAVGASYITTREHRADIDELTDQEWVELRDIVRILTEATKRQFGARHMNISCDMNDAAAAGTPTHVHFKLRGRGSRLITIATEQFSDGGYGTKNVASHDVSLEALHAIRERIEAGD